MRVKESHDVRSWQGRIKETRASEPFEKLILTYAYELFDPDRVGTCSLNPKNSAQRPQTPRICPLMGEEGLGNLYPVNAEDLMRMPGHWGNVLIEYS